ncbi:hypothetical protein TanjilG_23560 [Lupinus angustifolius]|uniref:Dirigent protein n=1 Tax=Lupinus angustifolius TaxID=3871 RepID=A0A4P1RAI5_LUPAN|nr:PREDICTED: dirigent protein 24-like [Lupinus angustifolius]OIW05774.1 hypothetical protein TanjilG_23560 [Lupinus angustifolius]
MVKKLTFTPFPLKSIVFHLFLLSIAISNVKTDKVLTFFMHNNLGGLSPSGRIVAGIIANSQTSNIPFSKPNNRVFPIKGSVPLVDISIDIYPGSPTNTAIISNIDKNKVVIDHSKTLPYVIQNQLPLGATLGNILFGRITVIDDEITQGREFGSEVIGKAQGFHLGSSLDGNSQTMAFTTIFGNEEHEEEDAISFFGVHHTVELAHESFIAVVGGTGKYENARGYAKLETLHLSDDQHKTNYGVETLLQITVYLN